MEKILFNLRENLSAAALRFFVFMIHQHSLQLLSELIKKRPQFSAPCTIKYRPAPTKTTKSATYFLIARGQEQKYLGVISDPPDVGDRSHLAGPQNSSQVHFLVLHRHKGSREMDVLQLTCSHTHTSQRERHAPLRHGNQTETSLLVESREDL